jgi:hypothetical protein
VLTEHSSGGVGSSGGGGGGGSDYSAMFSTPPPPPHKISPPGTGDMDNISCSSSALLGTSGGPAAGHRYPVGPEPTNSAPTVYNTTPSKYTLSEISLRILHNLCRELPICSTRLPVK